MRYRWVFMTGLGIGFVLGARAGRERYEQLAKLARKAADSPAVQQAAGAMHAQALGVAKAARQRLRERTETARARVGDALHERIPGMRARDANGQAGQGHGGYAPAPGTPQEPYGE